VSATAWLLALGAVLLIYAGVVGALLAAGRRQEARALAGFIPDCVVLVRRLLGDPEVSLASKLLLGGLITYLASPVDLVPDFIPVAGQLDDALLVALVLRVVLRGAGQHRLAVHWPGPASSLAVVQRLATTPRRARAGRAARGPRRPASRARSGGPSSTARPR
jgi:uncharacterized membrane protein YkvA (DUF1232 family)